MDYLLYFLLSVTLFSLMFSFSGAAEITNITVTEGEDCTLPCSRNTALELRLLEWTCLDLNKRLLVFRGRNVLRGYEDPQYTDRVELLDPQLQTLSVVLKNVTEEDRGTYECLVLYEDGEKIQKICQLIRLTVTEQGPETTNLEVKLSLGLILGLMFGLLFLISVVLCVWFLKRHKRFYSSESSCLEKPEKPPIPRAGSSSSSSSAPSTLSSTLSDGSETPLIKKRPLTSALTSA